MDRLVVDFRILSFWRVGTGEGDAAGFDAKCARDALGMPKIPGKQVRGLFREAMREWCEIGRGAPEMLEALFGSRAEAGEEKNGESRAGQLRFDDALLAEDDRTELAARPELIATLYRARRSTALLRDRMVAKPHSLRLEEVAIPLDLVSAITPLGAAVPGWKDALIAASPLIRAIGSGRSRGLGRVVVAVREGQR